MFGLGIWEVVLVLVVALIVLGPEKLPKMARQLGRGVRELKRAAHELQQSFSEADYQQRHATPPRPPPAHTAANEDPHAQLEAPKAPEEEANKPDSDEEKTPPSSS